MSDTIIYMSFNYQTDYVITLILYFYKEEINIYDLREAIL